MADGQTATNLPSLETLAASASSDATEPQITPTSTSQEFGVGSTLISEKDGMVLVYVPAGEFEMGSDADQALAECQKFLTNCDRDWFTDEEPIHTVYLDAFWIGKNEVTNAMYAKCVDAGKCEPPSLVVSLSRDSYYGNPEFDNYPVIFVSWNDAAVFCEWAGRRLPTEAEWEKAAGWDLDAKVQRIYPWGDSIDVGYANYAGDDNVVDTTAVGD